MSQNKKTIKSKYESPVVVPLGEMAKGSGQCEDGSANLVDCQDGHGAKFDCQNGNGKY